MRTNDFKAKVELKLEQYDEFIEEKFDQEFRDFLNEFGNNVITYNDVQGFLDSFEEPSEYEWAEDEVMNDYIVMQEARYDEAKGN